MLDTETLASVVALRKAGPNAKPRLRGTSHFVAFLLSPVMPMTADPCRAKPESVHR